MAENSYQEQNQSYLAQILSKVSTFYLIDWILGITLTCYIVGFFITSLYLGSIGIINLELIRVRYVLAGILFLLFIATISLPLYGLVKIFFKNWNNSPLRASIDALTFTINSYLFVFIGIAIIGYIVGWSNIAPLGINQNDLLPLNEWWNEASQEILNDFLEVTRFSLLILPLIVIGIILLMVLIVVIINPPEKDGTKLGRRQKLRAAIRIIIEKPLPLFRIIIGFYIFNLLYRISTAFLSLIRTNRTDTGTVFTNYIEGWIRFALSSFLIYAVLALFLWYGFMILRPTAKGKNDAETSSNPAQLTLVAISIILFIASTLLTVYSFGVYPFLPQQIGGGKIIPVQVLIENEKIASDFVGETNEVFLIDRTNSSSIFLVSDISDGSQSIIEVSNSQIDSITYLRETTGSEGRQSH